MPHWNEKLQQWGFLYWEDYSPGEWWGIDRSNMKIEPIEAFEFTCTPMFRDSCPIRSVVVTIYAKNREEADELFFRHAHQFFDNDINMSVKSLGGGYRQVKN